MMLESLIVAYEVFWDGVWIAGLFLMSVGILLCQERWQVLTEAGKH